MLLIAVGVPLIRPFDVLKDKPTGKLGLIAKVSVPPNPPLAVTGVNVVGATFIVNETVGIACTVEIAGGASTVSVKDLLLVCGTLSVTVIV